MVKFKDQVTIKNLRLTYLGRNLMEVERLEEIVTDQAGADEEISIRLHQMVAWGMKSVRILMHTKNSGKITPDGMARFTTGRGLEGIEKIANLIDSYLAPEVVELVKSMGGDIPVDFSYDRDESLIFLAA